MTTQPIQLKSIFSKPVDRAIEGVIKADDESGLSVEVEEYEFTNEIEKRLESFLESYNQYENANGVWISGFFGSGKSHLLKMVSLLLANRTVGDQVVLDAFLEKCKDNQFLQGALRKAVSIPSESILFNIDQQADVISKTQVDALLSVFVKVFDNHCGYYGKQAYIAQFERQLDEDGLLDGFCAAFEKREPKGWHWGRTRISRMAAIVDEAYTEVTGHSVTGVIDKFRSDYRLSIEDFAIQVKKYIASKGKDFRLNFFVDEAGQYIADNVKLMTNLQTVAESLNTKCDGQAWVIVTAQQDMHAVIGEMDKNQANDFSKIQDRFAIRVNLTSADVAEVIQKRLLKKSDAGRAALTPIYNEEKNNFKTLFDFTGGGQTYKNYQGEDDFVACYPFVPYQFTLFQLAIKSLSVQNAFEGKHRSVGERSMLGVFQEVAVRIADHDVGEIATFDKMFEGIRVALKSQTQTSINIAERALDNQLAIKLLKALFLVKYIREFKANVRNLCVLMTSHFDQDMETLRTNVETALNLLETEVYIQRNGDTYEFLTDDEKDVEREIKNASVDTKDIADELSRIIFDQILKTKKLRYEPNKQDFAFTRKLDDRNYGREHELAVHIISPFHEDCDNVDKLKMAYMGRAELLIVLPPDDRLIKDLTLHKQTEKYIGQNMSLTNKEAVKRILTNKQLSNQERYADLCESVKALLGKSRLFVAGNEAESGSEDPTTRLHEGFERLIIHAYPNLPMLREVTYTESMIQSCLDDSDDGLFGGDTTIISEPEQEVLSYITRQSNKNIRTSIKLLVEHFEKQPYGWAHPAIQCTLAKLIARGKIEARSDGEILDGIKLVDAIKNTRQHVGVLLEPQIDFTPSQVRRLKEFYQDFFDKPCSSSDAKAIGKQTADAFGELHQELSVIAAQTGVYPFVSELAESADTVGGLAKKGFKFFLTEFEGQADTLLDLKENLIDPIRRFMSGSQATLYREARQFIQDNESNFVYIDGDEGAELKRVLTSKECYRGSAMKDAKETLERLQQKIQARADQERLEIEKALAEKSERIKAIDGFEKLPDECKADIDQAFSKATQYVQSQPLIAVIREAGSRFQDNTYADLLTRVDRKINATSSGEETVTDNPPETPPQPVSIGSIKVGYSKPWLTSDAEVDEYVAKLATAMKSAIQDGKKIQL